MKLEDEIAQKKFKNDYQKAAINIIFTSNWVQTFHQATLKPYEISLQQFNILRILRGQFPNPASLKLIKERMLDRMSDTSRLVEKLRLKELVYRTTCPNDRRNVDVVITDKGLKLLSDLDQIDEKFKKTFSTLTSKEIIQLNDLLDKLRG